MKKRKRKKSDPIMVNTPILTNWVEIFEKCKKRKLIVQVDHKKI
jgi:hypothetical protein